MYPAKYRQALAHLRTNAHNLDPEKGRWEHKGRYNRCGLISFQKEYLIHGRWILVCVRLFFHKPLKIYYVFLPVVLAFFPSLSFPVVRPNYAVIVGEKKTSAACSLLLPVNDKKASTCFTQQVWYLLLWCALLKLHFHPQIKGLISWEILYFVCRHT